MIASRISGRFTPSQLVLAGLGTITAGLLCIAGAPRRPGFYAASFIAWSLASFIVQAQQQARLIAARTPGASATVALDTSAIYVGQALGGITGALILLAGAPDRLPVLAALILVAAIAMSLLADRLAAGNARQYFRVSESVFSVPAMSRRRRRSAAATDFGDRPDTSRSIRGTAHAPHPSPP